jgi:hypothetical protein
VRVHQAYRGDIGADEPVIPSPKVPLTRANLVEALNWNTVMNGKHLLFGAAGFILYKWSKS